MGTKEYFSQKMSLDNEPRVKCKPQWVEVLDNHSIPEILIGPVDAPYEGRRATFNDWKQFERFVEDLNTLRNRLAPIHTKR
ncbi:hypothetical protein P8629_06420 [Hydrogenovibrio sp. 3SP14C1]|uniref:hypothetical protein n=1 Tax=Hydrogenovibrio sp. 3SP14C1 TaxID=3038774 RepID=UPI00241721C1|nr:hypothetical protein [Hydrogenovibrio sp. 3SP14C1]MDG4812639.1 hypothetical protein [Hydrogenovibrio sp. 3SP14C1]